MRRSRCRKSCSSPSCKFGKLILPSTALHQDEQKSTTRDNSKDFSAQRHLQSLLNPEKAPRKSLHQENFPTSIYLPLFSPSICLLLQFIPLKAHSPLICLTTSLQMFYSLLRCCISPSSKHYFELPITEYSHV